MGPRICSLGFFLALALWSAAPARSQAPASTDGDLKAQELKLYSDAHPYIDEPQATLERIMPELRGLQPASSQDQLPTVLAGTGAKVKELLQEIPNLTSTETVGEDLAAAAPRPLGFDTYERASSVQPSSSVQARKGTGDALQVHTFNYLVLAHDTGGERMLQEYRTDRSNNSVAQDHPTAPSSIGFISMWVVFSPANESKSRFRYLGEQKIGGHKTFVVAFAQKPGTESHPGTITLPRAGSVPMLCQGIAWIDESDFRILRLRTDLLAPQPRVGVSRLTGVIHFGAVRIAKFEAQLWLPKEVKINIEANGLAVQELHQYSQYRLYRAEAKIVTGAISAMPAAGGRGPELSLTMYGENNAFLDRQALVKLVNKSSQAVLWQTTQNTAQVVFSDLSPGVYEVDVSAAGYLTSHKEFDVEGTVSYYQEDIVLGRDPASVGLRAPSAALMPAKAGKETLRGVAALQSGDYKEAQKQLETAYKLVPSNPDINLLLGYLAFEEKDEVKAESYLRKASAQGPSNVEALTLLGRVYLEGEDYKKAIAVLEEALAADNDSWMAHDLLANAFFQQHEYEKAWKQAEFAIEKGKGNANSARLVLGEALIDLGHHQEGVEELKTFLQEMPNTSLAPQVLDVIAKVERHDNDPSSHAQPVPTSSVLLRDNKALPVAVQPEISIRTWEPPGIDEVKPAIAAGVACPESEVITSAGARVKQLVDDVARFSAIEELVHERVDELGNPLTKEVRQFDYVESISDLGPGLLSVDEYRSEQQGLADFPDHIATHGFTSLALVFHPHMRDNFQMMCEGLGQWQGQATWLIHFRQRDDRPSLIDSYKVGGQMYPVKLKGRAWIMADHFQIVHMESQLVSPMPNIQLLTEHQIVEYGPISFPKKNTELWLPKSAELYFNFRKQRYFRRHSFGHYMLFSIDTQDKQGAPAEPAKRKPRHSG